MTEYRHVTFNPTESYLGISPLREILRANEPEGWSLLRVVHNNHYEAVAVLERAAHIDGEDAPDR